jgi:Beta-lactamase
MILRCLWLATLVLIVTPPNPALAVQTQVDRVSKKLAECVQRAPDPVAPRAPETPREVRASVCAVLEAHRESQHIPGLAFVAVKDDKAWLLEATGLRDLGGKLPVKPDTVFPIGSCAKSFTSIADDPVYIVKLTPKSGPSALLFVSRRTSLILKEQTDGETVIFSDHGNVDGEVVPFRRSVDDVLGESTIELQDIRFNAVIAAASFGPTKP